LKAIIEKRGKLNAEQQKEIEALTATVQEVCARVERNNAAQQIVRARLALTIGRASPDNRSLQTEFGSGAGVSPGISRL
jgi:hypothetical protein